MKSNLLIDYHEPVLITGSAGFIGSRLVKILLKFGFTNIRCFVRPSSNVTGLHKTIASYADKATVDVTIGNLLSRDDCKKAIRGVSIVYHLAAGIGKSFPNCFLNSVVATRNLLDPILEEDNFKRFVNVGSFTVYDNSRIKRGGLLDETCEIEDPPTRRGEAYCYGKLKQDELIMEYHNKFKIPYVIIRPGAVYGPGKNSITGRVGIGTFGVYLHLGGSNMIPLTYVDNCAEAIMLAGITKDIDGEIFNVVDDDLPRSRDFLRMYKNKVENFTSIPVPFGVAYILSYLWEKYSEWSEGQLPPAFNRSRCNAEWKGNRYSNQKLKDMLGWQSRVPTDEGLTRYFEYSKNNGGHR